MLTSGKLTQIIKKIPFVMPKNGISRRKKSGLRQRSEHPMFQRVLFTSDAVWMSQGNVVYKYAVPTGLRKDEALEVDYSSLMRILKNANPMSDVIIIISGTNSIRVDGMELRFDSEAFKGPLYEYCTTLTEKHNNATDVRSFVVPGIDLASLGQFVGNDELRPAFSMICFAPNAIVATDARILVKQPYSMGMPPEWLPSENYLMPSSIARYASKQISFCRYFKEMNASENNVLSMLSFSDIPATLYYTLPEVSYPNYEAVFPAPANLELRHSINYPYAEILQACRKAQAVSNQNTRKMVLEIGVDYTTVSVHDEDYSLSGKVRVRHIMPVLIETPFEIVINASLLLKIIKASDPLMPINIKYDLSSPAKVLVVNDTFLLMPMMID